MPIASDSSATTVTPGSRRRLRSATLTSCRSVSSMRPPANNLPYREAAVVGASKVRHAVGGVSRARRSLPHQPAHSVSGTRVHPLAAGARALPDVLHEHGPARGVSRHVAWMSGGEPAAVVPEVHAGA